MQAHYFSLDVSQAKKILANCFPDSWEWKRFAGEEKVEYVFLFSPLWCHQHFISADVNWKNYLNQHHPETKLISVGVCPARSDNYVDLLRPPEDFTIFLKKAKICSAEWTPVDTCGLDMNQKLKRFFDGHGNESVQESFNRLLRRFRIVNDEISTGTSYREVYQELLQATQTPATWQKLVNRWQAYYSFFECLPFYSTFEKVNDLLTEVQPYFDEQCQSDNQLQNLHIIDKIESINRLLKEAEQYVQKEPPHTDR
ncbi:MAG: hypothetical protein R2824_09785 [Saprospiraceae bacterium]|nr:hypothetical protein [Lewinella sp.]